MHVEPSVVVRFCLPRLVYIITRDSVTVAQRKKMFPKFAGLAKLVRHNTLTVETTSSSLVPTTNNTLR